MAVLLTVLMALRSFTTVAGSSSTIGWPWDWDAEYEPFVDDFLGLNPWLDCKLFDDDAAVFSSMDCASHDWTNWCSPDSSHGCARHKSGTCFTDEAICGLACLSSAAAFGQPCLQNAVANLHAVCNGSFVPSIPHGKALAPGEVSSDAWNSASIWDEFVEAIPAEDNYAPAARRAAVDQDPCGTHAFCWACTTYEDEGANVNTGCKQAVLLEDASEAAWMVIRHLDFYCMPEVLALWDEGTLYDELSASDEGSELSTLFQKAGKAKYSFPNASAETQAARAALKEHLLG